MKQLPLSVCQQVGGGSYGLDPNFLLDMEQKLSPEGLLYGAVVSAAFVFFGVIWPVP